MKRKLIIYFILIIAFLILIFVLNQVKDINKNSFEQEAEIEQTTKNYISYQDEKPYHDLDLLSKYFSSWSLYTANWSENNCDIDKMMVVDVAPWEDTIRQNLSENTLYKLSTWSYLVSYEYGINLPNCSWIIWNSETKIFSSWDIKDVIWIINSKNSSNIVLDSLFLDWKKEDKNINYLIFLNAVNNSSFSNIVLENSSLNSFYIWNSIYNNFSNISWKNNDFSMLLNSSSYNDFRDISFHSFSAWIHLNNSNYNKISNLYVITDKLKENDCLNLFLSNYNVVNNAYLISWWHDSLELNNSSRNSINNSKLISSGSSWINIVAHSNNNILSNLEISDNYAWIWVIDSDNNILNNIYSHNNSYYGIILQNSIKNVYYGSNNFYSNSYVNAIWEFYPWRDYVGVFAKPFLSTRKPKEDSLNQIKPVFWSSWSIDTFWEEFVDFDTSKKLWDF